VNFEGAISCLLEVANPNEAKLRGNFTRGEVFVKKNYSKFTLEAGKIKSVIVIFY